MKNLTVIIVFLISVNLAFGQLGVGTLNPDGTALLDLSSTDKGVLMPRLTQIQQKNISNPAHSLLVFCTDCSPLGIYYYNSSTSSWNPLDTDTQLSESMVDAMVANNGYLTSFTEADGSVTNEIQNLVLNNNTLSIDNANNVDLSRYLDNSDNQQISKSGRTITLQNGGSFQDSILTENQVDAFVNNNGYLTSFSEVDGSITNEIQTISRSGSTITLSNNGGNFIDNVLTETQVDAMVSNNGYIASEVDGSTTNEIQNLSLSGNNLNIDGAIGVDLSSFKDNTDKQQISKSGRIVTLQNGGNFQDSILTEAQVDAMVSDNGYLTSFSEVDGSITNEIQTLSRSGNTITLSNNGGNFTDNVLTETEVDAMVSNNGYITSEVDGSITNEIQNLSLSGNTLNIEGGTGVSLSSIKDNLGNHTVTQNIKLNEYWLSNDGDDEGLFVNTSGNVGIGFDIPRLDVGSSIESPLHVAQVSNTLNGLNNVLAIFGDSYENNILSDSRVEIRGKRNDITAGDGPNLIFTNYDNFSGLGIMGDISALGEDGVSNLGGLKFRTSSDGSSLTNALLIDTDQNLSIPNGTLSIGGYTLPATDGSSSQILKTDGNGNVSWSNNNTADNLGNHIASKNLNTGSNWISNGGANEGIYIATDGKVTTSSNLNIGGSIQTSSGVYASLLSSYSATITNATISRATISDDLTVTDDLTTSTVAVGGGSQIQKILHGVYNAGTSTKNQSKEVTLTFSSAFSNTPTVTATTRDSNNGGNVYVVTIQAISKTSVTFKIRRENGNSWGKNVHIHWMAMD